MAAEIVLKVATHSLLSRSLPVWGRCVAKFFQSSGKFCATVEVRPRKVAINSNIAGLGRTVRIPFHRLFGLVEELLRFGGAFQGQQRGGLVETGHPLPAGHSNHPGGQASHQLVDLRRQIGPALQPQTGRRKEEFPRWVKVIPAVVDGAVVGQDGDSIREVFSIAVQGFWSDAGQ